MTKRFPKKLLLLLAALLALQLCGAGALAATTLTADYSQCGLRVHYDERYQQMGLDLDGAGEDMEGHPAYAVSFCYAQALDPIFERLFSLDEDALTQEVQNEISAQIDTHIKCLLYVVLLPKEEYSQKIQQGLSLDHLTGVPNTRLLGENGGYTYLYALPENDTDGMSQEEVTLYEACKAYMPQLCKQIEFIPLDLEGYSQGFPRETLSFTTTDLDGNPVDASIFAQSDLTILNVWGTFCAPCIGEIPELGEWARSLPSNVRLIGLVSDISSPEDAEQIELAKEIMQKANADYLNLIASETLQPFLAGIVGVPTTFFINSEGAITGEPVTGADVPLYKQVVEDFIHAGP